MMTESTETLRREFEAACVRGQFTEISDNLRNWMDVDPDRQCYISPTVDRYFRIFCAGRQSAQAEIERLQSVVGLRQRHIERLDADFQVISDAVGNTDLPVVDAVKKLKQKRDELRAIVDRIPKFADGSPALPGDEAWPIEEPV